MNVLTAIYVAQDLTRQVAAEETGKQVESHIDMEYLKTIGKADQLDEWRMIARVVADKYKTLTQ